MPRGKRTGRPRLEGTSYTVSISVTNRNKATIDRLSELFGGTQAVQRVRHNKNSYFLWRVGTAKAVVVLELILPFLVGKCALAQTCISFHYWYAATMPRPGEGMLPERRAQAEVYHQTCRALIARFRSAPGENKVVPLTVEAQQAG